MKLDDQLLNRFIHTFYGHGNFAGKYWFVGMEEGGGNDLNEVSNRLSVWQKLKEQELVDNADFHLGLDEIPRYFSDPVKLQRTWMQLIRMVLFAEGKSANLNDLKAFQRDQLGRKDQNTCLLELLPLCSPDSSKWHYAEWSDLPFLKNRDSYRNYCREWRCSHLRSLIETHQPETVVFYSTGYLKWWQEVTGPAVIFQEDNGVRYGVFGKTQFLITHHPATVGVTNEYFEKAGLKIQSYRQAK